MAYASRPKELVRLATEVGLDAAEVEEALGDQRFASAVRDDEAEARSIGVSGVPFFRANRELAISGAQSVDILGRMLDMAWGEAAAGVSPGRMPPGSDPRPRPASPAIVTEPPRAPRAWLRSGEECPPGEGCALRPGALGSVHWVHAPVAPQRGVQRVAGAQGLAGRRPPPHRRKDGSRPGHEAGVTRWHRPGVCWASTA